jgi:alkaline phosphatase
MSILAVLLAASATAAAASRNVILFLGDGMGVSTVTAARIHAGQRAGGTGEEHRLSFEAFPNVALVKTFLVDRQVPKSAGTMSAIVTGQPGRYGVLSVAPEVPRGDCAGALANPLPTLLEQAERAGLLTGVVTTAAITHATPAATYAHVPERGWQSDISVPAEARALGCRDIARQLVEFEHGNGIEILLGGGRENFLPITQSDPEYDWERGRRLDGRNLVDEWLQLGEERQYVWNAEQLAALDPAASGAVLGLFEPYHMQFNLDRAAGAGQEPSLVEMTEFAIRRLQRSEQGYFLLVEGGRIDHAHHNTNAARALDETLAMDAAVSRALELTDPSDTLILVTADHSHTLTISGYPPRGNPILGTVTPESDVHAPEVYRRSYTTLGYMNGPGYASALPDVSVADTTHPDYRQFAGYPMPSETHAGEDVAAYAHGLGAERLRGVIEQRQLYDVLRAALFGDGDRD